MITANYFLILSRYNKYSVVPIDLYSFMSQNICIYMLFYVWGVSKNSFNFDYLDKRDTVILS